MVPVEEANKPLAVEDKGAVSAVAVVVTDQAATDPVAAWVVVEAATAPVAAWVAVEAATDPVAAMGVAMATDLAAITAPVETTDREETTPVAASAAGISARVETTPVHSRPKQDPGQHQISIP